MPEYDYRAPVSHLLLVGVTDPEDEDWPDYQVMGFGRVHVPELLRLSLDSELNRLERRRPHLCGPVHAWRTLGELQAQEAVAPLTSLFPRVDSDSDEWVVEALPRALGRMGADAIPELSGYLADSSHGTWARITASASVAEIGKWSAPARDEAVRAVSGGLEGYGQHDPTLNAFLVRDLVELKATEAAPVIEEAFASRRVNFLVQGDWEDVQVELGLLEHRLSPREFRWEPGRRGRLHIRPRTRRGGAAATKQKRKRKQAKKSRRRNRRR